MSDLPSGDWLLANIARFLIDGNEEDAANLVLSCELELWESGDSWFVGDETHYALHVNVNAPRVAYDILRQPSHPIARAFQNALEAVRPAQTYIKHLTFQAKLVDIDPDWRSELLEIARGKGVHNQATEIGAARIRLWNNLRFRSESEIKIAQALDRHGAMFFPNCKGRLSTAEGRKNREADFLVCHEGKWGILEVDGEPFHPPTRTAQDHERDRLFRAHGVRVVEHFDAEECYTQADVVVQRFLNLLKNA